MIVCMNLYSVDPILPPLLKAGVWVSDRPILPACLLTEPHICDIIHIGGDSMVDLALRHCQC